MADLEESFHQAMLEVYVSAREDCDYDASPLLDTVNENGGLKTARTLLHASSVSDGFQALCTCERLDLTVEALVLKHQWQPLFSDEELAIARRRLKESGWKTPLAW